MTLRTASRQKHLRTGVYWFRKRVPERLRPVVGKTEVTRTLGTEDAAEAKRRFVEVALEVEQEWALLERRSTRPQADATATTLTEKQAPALAGEVYPAVIASREDEPGSPLVGRVNAAEGTRAFAVARIGAAGDEDIDPVEDAAGAFVDAHLARLGLRIDGGRGCASAGRWRRLSQAQALLVQRAEGDWSPDPKASRFPPIETIDVLDWRTEFARYVRQQKPNPKTVRSFEKRIGELMARVGSNDLRKITADHVESWTSDLLDAGKHPNTVRNGYLAAVKRICSFVRLKLPMNPAVGIPVPAPRDEKLREKGFTIGEARMILRAASAPPPNRLSPDRRDARRWVPWICAYTGARVNEVTQMRRQDVVQVESEDGNLYWMMRITPEAGSNKTNAARTVAVHPHLIEQGFLDFVRLCERPELFYDKRRSRGGSTTHPLYQKTGEYLASWVRNDVGVKDGGVKPNHGWRHRFRSVARAADLDPPLIDAILGHAPSTVGETYGDRWPEVLHRAICRIPRYRV